MKVVIRRIMKVFPGKMAEAMELEKKYTAIASRLGAPPSRGYRCFSGGGDHIHTVIAESEWDSFAALDTYFEKTSAHPEIQALSPVWDTVIESCDIEFLLPIP